MGGVWLRCALLVDVVLVDHLTVDEIYDLTIFEVFLVRGNSEDSVSRSKFDH